MVVLAVGTFLQGFLVGGAIVGAGTAYGAALGTIAGGVALAWGYRIKWADWIGMGSGFGATLSLGLMLGTALTVGLH